MNTNTKHALYTILGGFIIIVLYLLPLIILQEDAYVLIHDNLDCHPMQFANIYRELPPVFFDSQFPQILNGSLRPSSGLNLNLSNLPYHYLNPFSAYLLIQLTSRLVAFFGMFLLLSTLLRKPETNNVIISGSVAALFAILPHYPPLAFSIPILPWLSWCFVNIARHQTRWIHWLVFLLVPFFSNFFVAPIFLFMLVGIWWIFEIIRKKHLNLPMLGALFFCGLIYVVSEHHLLTSLLNNAGYQSIRSERIIDSSWLSFTNALVKITGNFVVGQYHVFSLHEFILLVIYISIVLHIRSRAGYTKEYSMLLGLVMLCAVISAWLGIYYWRPMASWRTETWSFFNMIGWDRFHWLHPLLWTVAFAYALTLLFNHSTRWKYIACGFLFLQGVYLFNSSDYMNEKRINHITFRQFYAEQQFGEIKAFIGKDPASYRVASLGIHPSISIYNGFYALDGYSTDYDIAHKNRFRTIIEPELEKNPTLNQYFESYGLRCYLFSSELGKYPLYTKWKNRGIERLDLNLEAFMSLNGQYILSAVEIKQAENCGLRLLRIFDSPNSAWRILLYQPAIAPIKLNTKTARPSQGA